MQKYELTIALDSKVTAAKKKKVEETVGKIVSLLKGKVGKSEDWGLVESNSYVFFPLELEQSSARMVSIKLSQETDVKRHLIIKVD